MTPVNASSTDLLDPGTRRLLRDFESLTIGAGEFHHEQHARVGWALLTEEGLLDTLDRFPAALRRFAAHHGADGLYHETITWLFLLLINERRNRLPRGHGWHVFAEAWPDLVHNPKKILSLYYSPEWLRTDLARSVFVLPDRLMTPPKEAPDDSQAKNIESTSGR